MKSILGELFSKLKPSNNLPSQPPPIASPALNTAFQGQQNQVPQPLEKQDKKSIKKIALLGFIVIILFFVVIRVIKNIYSSLMLSPIFSIKLIIGFLLLFVLFVGIRLLRPGLITRVLTALKNKLLQLFFYLHRHYQSLDQRALNWLERFKIATGKEKWQMTRTQVIALVIVILLYKFGPLLIPPQVLTTFPGNKSLEAPLDTNIEVIFNKGVIKSTAEKSFSITPQIPGKISWESNQKLIFTPGKNLQRGKEYKVSFKGLILSSFFIPLVGDSSVNFETIGNPKVVIASPKLEAVENQTPVTVVFDRPMIPLTTAANNSVKQPAFTISPQIKGDGKWLGTTAYQFRPTQDYRMGTTYTVTVPSGITSQDGGKLVNTYTWEFSSNRPNVISVTPEFGYSYASPVASIAAYFDQQINPASIANKFNVFDANGNKVAGNIIVTGNIAGFYPSSALKRSQAYKAVISQGVEGVEGPNGMEQDYGWNFTTAASPAITSTNPGNNEKNVSEQYRVEVRFKTPMDEDSFKDNVTIDPAPALDPSLNFSDYNYENILSIGTYLGRSQKYTITIGANVKDQYGVALGTPYTFSFTTSPYQPSLSIYPFNTYFGAFNQQVTQRVVAQVINTNKIDYTLYKLKTADVLDLYRKHYDYNQCSQDEGCRDWQNYDTGKLTKVNSWSQSFDMAENTPTQVVTKVTLPGGGNLPSGFYFLDLKIPQGTHDNMVMIVSKSTLTVKRSDSQIFTWSVDQSSGNTVSNMNIQLLDEWGVQQAQGTTNSDGVFEKDIDLTKKDNLLVVGQSGDDLVIAASAWNQGIDIYDFGLPSYYSANEQKDSNATQSYKTYLLLDRPIFRPGQTVYFKGVIRKDNDGAYENLPSGAEVSVSITDARGREAYNQVIPITSFGSFAGNFNLGKDANLGYYNITSTYQGNSANQSFQVEEYKKPDLAVTINPSKTDYVQGETADININASYYFGAPVSNTPISYTVDTQDYSFQWSKNWRFEFGDPDAYWDRPWWYYSGPGYSSQTQVTSGAGKTDQQGNFEIKLPVDLTKQTASQQMVIEAYVNDINNQEIAASQTITLHKSAIYAGLHASEYANQAGNPASVDIVTVDDKGTETPNTQVFVSFYKRTWEVVREQNPDDGIFYYTSKASDSLVTSTTTTTDAQGYGKASFTPTEGGTYKAVVKVTDKSGNQNTSGSFLWVSGTGFQAPRENNDRIVVTTDKPDYFVGDKLSMFVATPYSTNSAKTLLTAERGKVLDYKIVDASDSSNNFQMSVSNKYVPNVYMGAVLVKPGSKVTDPAEFKVGYAPVKVTDKTQQLVVNITTDSNRYKPRDTIHATIETKDATGRPVSSEVAVGLVDKAVWDLAQVELPDIYKVFFEPRSLSVSTAQLLTMSIDRVNANLNLGAKGGSGGGCFAKDTPVLMKGGVYKKIQDIKTGDVVLTRENDNSDKIVESKVLQTFKHQVDKYLIINGFLKITSIHKIFVNGKWTVAGTIVPGDYLLDKNNNPVKVFSVEQVMGNFAVYNLETEKYHTYFAGDIYVHNQKGGGFDTSRNNFPDTAYWNPYVKTGSDGKAQIAIKLPDSLTTWRLAAVANTSQDAFGQSTAEVKVSRDVLIRSFMPRFLAVGDKPNLGAIIVNTSGKDQIITAKIEASGLSVSESQTKQQMIPDGGEAKITWSVVTQNVSSANIKISVIDDSNRVLDSLTTKLPVKSYSVPETVAASGQAKDTASEKILLPKFVDKTQGEATLTFSPSLGSAGIDAIKFLNDYPYYSVENTTSKFVASIYINRLFKKNNLTTDGIINQNELINNINDGLQRLNNQQHPDGGWGWYIECNSDPYLTAYAYLGLAQAKKDGYTVSNQTLLNARNYLTSQLSGGAGSTDLNVKAFILYVLSDNSGGLSGYGDNLFQRRFELTLKSRAYLAIALRNISGSGGNANKLYDELLSMAKLTATTAHWEEVKKDYYLFGTNSATTAVMLEVLMDFDKKSSLIPEVIRYFMTSNKDGYWVSTFDTAEVIKAITLQLLSTNEQNVDEHYQVLLNGKKTQEGAFAKGDILKILHSVIPIDKFNIGSDNKLSISKSGLGNLYYNLNLKYYLPFSTIDALDQGIVVSRNFVDDNGNELPQDSIKQNSEAWVRLIIVAPADRYYVAVEDILPAGLESVNESLKNVSTLNKQPPKSANTNQGFWYFSHKEYHDDQTTLFASYLPAGVYEISYRVRATTPGIYHYPPAQAYETNVPDVSGHSQGGWLEVK